MEQTDLHLRLDRVALAAMGVEAVSTKKTTQQMLDDQTEVIRRTAVAIGAKESGMEGKLAKVTEGIVKAEMEIELHGLEQRRKQLEKRKKDLKLQDDEIEEEEEKKKQKVEEDSTPNTITVFLRCNHAEDDDWKYFVTVIDLEETEIKRDLLSIIEYLVQYEWPENRGIESEALEEGQRICVYSTVIESEYTVEDDEDDTKVQGTVFLGHALPTAGKDKKTEMVKAGTKTIPKGSKIMMAAQTMKKVPKWHPEWLAVGEGEATDSKMDDDESEDEDDEEEKKKPEETAMEQEGKVNLGIVTANTNVTRCRNGVKQESRYQDQERHQRKETAEMVHCHQFQLASSTCLVPLSRPLKLSIRKRKRRISNDIETNQNLTNKLNEHKK